jgi:GNAT superfamily N-acetyltransferase
MTATPKPSVSDSGERFQARCARGVVIRELELVEHHYLSLLCDEAFEFVFGGKSSSAGHGSLGENTWCAGAFSGEIFVGVTTSKLIDIPGVAETSLFVVEPWRRSGIGSALLQATEPWAREQGCNVLRIRCLRSNWSMRAFLERVGTRFDLVVGQIVAEIRTKTLTDKATVVAVDSERVAEQCFNAR